MPSISLFVFFVLSHLLLLHSAEGENRILPNCSSSFQCGKFGIIGFPFTNNTPHCGLLPVNCTQTPPTIHLDGNGGPYEVINISYTNTTQSTRIKDLLLSDNLNTQKCQFLTNLTFSNSPSISYEITSPKQTLFKCNRTLNITSPKNFKNFSCGDYNIYYSHSNHSSPTSFSECSIIQLPRTEHSAKDELFSLLSAEFDLKVHVSDACSSCHGSGGSCGYDHEGKFDCKNGEKDKSTDKGKSENHKKIKLWVGLGVGCTVIFKLFVFFIIRHYYKKKYASSNLLARNAYSDPSSRSEVDGGNVYFGVPVFSYSELVEATNNFDLEKELGNGGFGTVYHGKLHDGREVAVKRLYGHNYRRVQQFINEVEILTCLRHKNLVSLYGCTSRHCHELLLVYEYIPNGTIADHIHGHRATPGSFTWPTRMSIAIETASALAYLHASDIIHRDIKTNNILLDDNFRVKVADFGLSRLFPNDVSHVSTAPQGTPGYLDPEYHHCYQLTSKSDVYSFGVVLIELLSSLPAVDMFRQRHEINLANLAKNKIEKGAFHELIDPYLGFESDYGVKTMTILVAKLAFQCLQQDKEMRPSMDEVLEALKKIQSGEDAPDLEMAYDDAVILNVKQPASPDCDEVGLLKTKRLPPSPEAVTDNWTSRSNTPNVSV
ncbi:LEAF RUST 10 DISEASE-RESISTANCE LOCUS RECEPTOR-LIKE PROTEIN KINASE-like 1.1 isoform X1 [Fagus crenata]